MKSADPEAPTVEELYERLGDLGLSPTAELQKVRDTIRDEMFTLLGHSEPRGTESLEAKARRTALEVAELQIASFTC
jgi:hypothetical protein